MNNELIKTMDELSKKLFDGMTELESIYGNAKEQNASANDLNNIARKHNEMLEAYNSLKKDRKNYILLSKEAEKDSKYEKSLHDYENHIMETYFEMGKKEKQPMPVIEPDGAINNVQEPEYEEVEEKSNKNRKNILSALALTAAIMGVFALGRSCGKSASTVTEIKNPTKTAGPATPSTTIKPTEAPKVIDGSYGTFTDATDDEQVKARANYIYEHSFKDVINKIGNENNEYKIEITPESIANVIRVYNDELPIENGYKVYDDSVINYYITLANKMYATLMSDERLGYIGCAPMAALFEDNSQAQYLAEVFDEDYKNIAAARNSDNYEESVKALKELGYDLRDRVLLFAGLNGEMTPMTVREHANGSYTTAMGRFAAYVIEWNLSNKKAVCIPVCTDYETGKEQEWPIVKIYETIETGEYNNVVARMTGSGIEEDPIGKTLYEEHDEILRNKYELEKSKTLTK